MYYLYTAGQKGKHVWFECWWFLTCMWPHWQCQVHCWAATNIFHAHGTQTWLCPLINKTHTDTIIETYWNTFLGVHVASFRKYTMHTQCKHKQYIQHKNKWLRFVSAAFMKACSNVVFLYRSKKATMSVLLIFLSSRQFPPFRCWFLDTSRHPITNSLCTTLKAWDCPPMTSARANFLQESNQSWWDEC